MFHQTQKIKGLIPLLLWITYPTVIFFGLKFLEPRYVALGLALLLITRWRQGLQRTTNSLSRVPTLILISMLGLAILTSASNSELLLRSYPAAMNFGMLLIFGLSLWRPPSFIETIARLGTPNLSNAGVAYTRRVTQIWCLFFLINGSIATYTVFYVSREQWALYNGFIAYIAIGVIFASEWLVRRRFIARDMPDA